MNKKLKVIEDEKSWYQEGLSFKCTGCGKCCCGAPGYIWVTDEEIEKIREKLKLSKRDFYMKYLVQVGNKFSIKDLKNNNYSCAFLRDGKCSIYEVRPKQCRTYPFWPSIMKSKEAWEDEALACEGIRPDSPKVSLEEIEEKLSS